MALASTAPAQSDSSSRRADSVARLETVVVTVTRGSGRSVLRSPFAVTIVSPDSTRPGQRHNAVDESLALIPGLTAVNRNNPSQDPRLSIRGFGARSAFGVRGVRVLRDGMPLTLPDGQTPLDYLSLESVGRIEVMRGAASALYGNASGGVIDIHSTVPGIAGVDAEARQWLGDDKFSRSVIAVRGMSGAAHFVADAAFTRGDGSRVHSEQRATSGFARGVINAGNAQYALTALALHNPLAENPGALTIEEMTSSVSGADPLSVRRNARKAVRQIQIGVSARRSEEWGEASLSAFGSARSLDNPLTFGIVEIGRHTQGASASMHRIVGARHRLVAGIDLQTQNDLRRNYATCADTVPTPVSSTCPDPSTERGAVTLDQRELVRSLGGYVSAEISLGSMFTATAGLRADDVRFEVRDRLVTDGNPDDSGTRSLRAVSPIAGIIARVATAHSVYANLSAAFETPTATELGNQPDGSAGINPVLNPQRSTTVELGVKGFIRSGIHYDAAVFDTRVRDELVAFEIPNSDGRRFFRNAGRTRRRGGEAGVDARAGPVSLMLAYSYSRFRFEEYTTATSDFAGKFIPGIPRHRLQGALTLRYRSGFGALETELSGSPFVDDANTTRAPGYELAHLRTGFSPLRGVPRLSVTVGLQNIFDRKYAASLAVNAARGRYYEPAPGRTAYFGVTVGAGTGVR